jgi:putative transposase
VCRAPEPAPPWPTVFVMGRPLRNEAPGYHHVVTRGNNKRAIYLDDVDRTLFCLRVERLVRRCDWQILAYVLMRNHYHLLLRIGDDGLSGGMQDLNQGHAVTFNARHDRINHLFGKRFWSRHLTTDVAVQAAARYIVQNPVRAGGTLPLEGYEWSSYAATVDVAFPRMPLARDELLPFFGSNPASSVDAYVRFCRQSPDPGELEGTCPVPGTVTKVRA